MHVQASACHVRADPQRTIISACFPKEGTQKGDPFALIFLTTYIALTKKILNREIGPAPLEAKKVLKGVVKIHSKPLTKLDT